jgi:hypothetical protein
MKRFGADRDARTKVVVGLWGVNSCFARSGKLSASNDNCRARQELLATAASSSPLLPSLRGPVPLLAVALAAWCGVASLEHTRRSDFSQAVVNLTDKRLLDAGPIEIADCGRKGCADSSDTI